LEALGVISMDENKDFRWVGIQESRVVNDISRRIAAKTLAGAEEPPEEPEDEESEEPEDDDMEIEKLQVKPVGPEDGSQCFSLYTIELTYVCLFFFFFFLACNSGRSML